MSEELLIRCAAPTLAGLKTGNMFTCEYGSRRAVQEEIRDFNAILAKRGLRLIPLCFYEKRVLLYLYRPDGLTSDFRKQEIKEILESVGYSDLTPNRCVRELTRRLEEGGDFPHEVGLFLGYPPEDVIGFMEKRTVRGHGFWNVYGDPEEAEKVFRKYRRCTECYRRLWKRGASMERLIVGQIRDSLKR